MLARHQDPIVAVATAPGRGAVGVVRVSGRGLGALVQAWLGRALVPRHASYLPFPDADGQPIDHGLALFFPAPHSYTGEDVLELQAHGGPVVLQLLLERCLQLAQSPLDSCRPCLPGLRLAQPGEFTERAFLNDKLDLTQAEAIADLIDASTETAARSASRSLSGAFSREIGTLREALIHLRMLVEATLDFPEEEIDFLEQANAKGQLLALQTQLAQVMARTRQGALLQQGIRVVIAGQPNAGKSSLLNALAGAELAIVTPIAGTTRDVLQQTIQIDGVPLHVVDTAGLREGQEVELVERMGIERAWAQIEQADAVLFLHDLARAQDPAYQAADAAIAQRLPPSATVLHVWNKCDLASGTQPASGPEHIALSARTGEGLQALRTRLLQQVGWTHTDEGVYMARSRHVQALRAVEDHLAQADALLRQRAAALDLLAEELRQAQNALGQITGEFSADDLLGVIFSSFCIGK